MNVQKARQLRQNSTDVERKLWAALRGRRLSGIKFRRQHPIRGYIVDFICLEKKLIIELDGGQHMMPKNQASDHIRTVCLEKHGFKVIRFWNNEVTQNLPGVLQAIKHAAE